MRLGNTCQKSRRCAYCAEKGVVEAITLFQRAEHGTVSPNCRRLPAITKSALYG